MALAHAVAGVLNCIFIITVPLGVQSFKMAGLALMPFGKTVVRARELRPGETAAVAGPAQLGDGSAAA